MQVWVADDNGYPSGQAGGHVVECEPALELRGLRPLTRSGAGPDAVRIDLPKEAQGFVSAAIYPMKDGRPDYAAGKPVAPSATCVEAVGLAGPWELHAFALQVNNGEGLYVGRYLRDARRLNYIVNNSADRASFRVRLSGAGPSIVWIYSPADGSIQRRSAPATLSMRPFTSLFVVEGPKPAGQVPSAKRLRRRC